MPAAPPPDMTEYKQILNALIDSLQQLPDFQDKKQIIRYFSSEIANAKTLPYLVELLDNLEISIRRRLGEPKETPYVLVIQKANKAIMEKKQQLKEGDKPAMTAVQAPQPPAKMSKKDIIQKLQILQEKGNAEAIAKDLYTNRFSYGPSKVGEILGDQKLVPVLNAYLDQFDFKNKDFAMALKEFLENGGFELPKEAQVIDRFMQAFANKFMQDNPNHVLKEADNAYVIAFATLMINTERTNPNVKESAKHTQKGFAGDIIYAISANMQKKKPPESLDEGTQDQLKQFSNALFDSIQKNPITPTVNISQEQAENLLSKAQDMAMRLMVANGLMIDMNAPKPRKPLIQFKSNDTTAIIKELHAQLQSIAPDAQAPGQTFKQIEEAIAKMEKDLSKKVIFPFKKKAIVKELFSVKEELAQYRPEAEKMKAKAKSLKNK